MTARARPLLLLLASASLFCATPSPSVPDSLVVEAIRLYGRGDCPALRDEIKRADLSAATSEQQGVFDLLLGFCAEREGQLLSAKERYARVMAKSARSFQAFEAALRLREIERLDKEGTTREELNQQADESRSSPLYQHGAKPLHRDVPGYPPGASAAGIEGYVLLDFAISQSGGITDLVVLASEPPFLFDGVALSAVRKWVYPRSDQDQPRRASVRFPFRIAPPSSSSPRPAERVDRSGLDPLELRGREIFESNLASGRAQHALVQAGHLSAAWNWIVVADGTRSIVRFVDDHGRVFADVRVDIFSSELEQVTIHEAPMPLPTGQDAMWKAQVAALDLVRSRQLAGCADHYTTAVLPSLEVDRSWDVYVMSVAVNGRTVPIGGHYRISLSPDPRIPPLLQAFSESCAPPAEAGDPDRLMITEATSSTPAEMYVYLNLRYGRPLGVALPGDGGLWYVERGRMWRPEDTGADPSSD